jgi:predicted O-methyltransferase YrrM
MAGAMPRDCTLITVEQDGRLAGAVRDLMAGDPGLRAGPGHLARAAVEVITGDAFRVLSGRGPFDLLFADCGVRDQADFASLVSLLRMGGRIVMDDVTPVRALPQGSPWQAGDPKRGLFAREARLAWTEVVLPDLENSLLVGSRVS